MKCRAFDDGLLLAEDSVSEIQADAFDGGQPCLDGDEIVISGRRFVAQTAFDDREDYVVLLPLEKGCAKLPKEFAAGDFQDVEVTRVIDVVAECALGIGDAMGGSENHAREGARRRNSKLEIRSSKQILNPKFEEPGCGKVGTKDFKHERRLVNTEFNIRKRRERSEIRNSKFEVRNKFEY
jgi:hypothetical protein